MVFNEIAPLLLDQVQGVPLPECVKIIKVEGRRTVSDPYDCSFQEEFVWIHDEEGNTLRRVQIRITDSPVSGKSDTADRVRELLEEC